MVIKQNFLSCVLLLHTYALAYVMFSSEAIHLYLSDFYNPIVFIISMSPTIMSFIFLKCLNQNLTNIKIKKENLLKGFLLSVKSILFFLFMVIISNGISNISYVSMPMIMYIFLLSAQEEIVYRGFLQKNLVIRDSIKRELILYLSWSFNHIFRSIYYSVTIDSIFNLIYRTATISLVFYLILRYIINKTDNLWGAINFHFLWNLIYELF